MVSEIGTTSAMHSTALGKAMLAHFTETAMERVLLTPGSLHRKHHDRADLIRRELRTIRERGFALDDGENEVGVRCIGAPVFDHLGQLVAALSIAGDQVTRITRERADNLAAALIEAATELSRRCGLGGSTSQPATDSDPISSGHVESVALAMPASGE